MKNKIKLFPLLLLIVSSFSLKAQSQFGANLAYGIPYYKIKVNTDQTEIKYQPLKAYELELNYKNRWPGLVNFGSSVSYQYKSAHFDVNQKYLDGNTQRYSDYELNYLYLKVFPEFVIGDKIKYYLQIGPSFSILFKSNIDGYTDVFQNNNDSALSRTIESGSASEDFKLLTFGFFTGMGVDIPISKQWKVSGNIQYQFNTSEWYAKEDNSYSERSLFFKLGVVYTLPQLSDEID